MAPILKVIEERQLKGFEIFCIDPTDKYRLIPFQCVLKPETFLLYEYRDLFIVMAVRNNRSELAIANRHQER